MNDTFSLDLAICKYQPLLSAYPAHAVEQATTSAMQGNAGPLNAMCAKSDLPYPATLAIIWAIMCGNFDRMTPAERSRDLSEIVVEQALFDSTKSNPNLACTAS